MNQLIWIAFISILPFIELRGAIPVGVGLGINPLIVFAAAVSANLIIIPFLFKILDFVFHWNPIKKLADRAHAKTKKYIDAYGYWGLMLFVSIPLPLTGAYTGCLVSYFLEMDRKKSMLSIAAGVVLAGIFVTLISTGAFAVVKAYIL